MDNTKIPRSNCFSLSDFKEFNTCAMSFFIKHHLGKKYELSEGSENQTIGCLLDLTIKKIHLLKGYGQPVENLFLLIKAAENEMRESVVKNGPTSYYGAQVKYLNSELITKTKEIFKYYYLNIRGKLKPAISSKTFWELIIDSKQPLKLWGGPDALELGEDGIPEVSDYKYFSEEKNKENLDMDLMPKLYVLLCAKELFGLGYTKARFIIRLWQEPNNNKLKLEFDLKQMNEYKYFFKNKIEYILNTRQVQFCKNNYCRICRNENRGIWLKELNAIGISIKN